jgi:hypothetical protein
MLRHKDEFSEQNKASCRTSLTPRLWSVVVLLIQLVYGWLNEKQWTWWDLGIKKLSFYSCCSSRRQEVKKQSLGKQLRSCVSTPTQSIFINLVNYGIKLSLFWVVVGQNPSQCRSKKIIQRWTEKTFRLYLSAVISTGFLHSYFSACLFDCSSSSLCSLIGQSLSVSLKQFRKALGKMSAVVVTAILLPLSYCCNFFNLSWWFFCIRNNLVVTSLNESPACPSFLSAT